MKPGMKYSLFTALTMLLLAGAIIVYQYLTSVTTVPMDSSQALSGSSGTADSGETDGSHEMNTASDFTVTDGDGNEVRLSDSFGQPIILNFWATWCPPCRSELPAFDRAHNQYKAEVKFMMIDLTDGYREEVDSVKKFVSDNGYTFPVYYDMKGRAANAYNAYSIPLTVAIDTYGNVYKTHLGAMDETSLEDLVRSLLEVK